MNVRLKEFLLYAALFSGLGIFSFLLLVNHTQLSERVAGAISPIGASIFFIIAFNLLGYCTFRISSWINRQYALHLRNRWKILLVYLGVMSMFLLMNYSLLVSAKLLVGATHPFTFPNGGERILIFVWLVELVILGLLLANRSMKNTLQLQLRAAELQKENNTARYAALQSQLNPHFLFNSLNTLIAEIEYNPTNAVRFTRKLSDVYRYVLQCQDKALVPLAEELDFLQAYLFLHEVRLGNCITCRQKIAVEHKDCLLPPLTLQLLVENVIKHNSISSNKPMQVDIHTTENGYLVVSNPIRLKKSGNVIHTPASSGVGLKNLSKRYKLMLGKDIIIENTHGYFTVKTPLSL